MFREVLPWLRTRMPLFGMPGRLGGALERCPLHVHEKRMGGASKVRKEERSLGVFFPHTPHSPCPPLSITLFFRNTFEGNIGKDENGRFVNVQHISLPSNLKCVPQIARPLSAKAVFSDKCQRNRLSQDLRCDPSSQFAQKRLTKSSTKQRYREHRFSPSSSFTESGGL